MTPPEITDMVPLNTTVPTPEQLIERALTSGVPVESLERLLAMHERIKAEAAREAFFDAMGSFQRDCPVIPKNKTVSTGQYTYRYAPLEAIVTAVAPLLTKYGLSYRFDTKFEESPPAQVVRCIISHRLGHSEESEFRAPIDTGARMNTMQQSASSLTYAKRYAFCNALGILTGDEDDDGRSSGARRDDRQAGRSGPGAASRQSAQSSSSVTGGTTGGSTTPRSIAPRNPVRIPRPSAGAQGSDPVAFPPTPSLRADPAEILASSQTAEALESYVTLRQEAWDKAALVEAAERRSRGQEVPEDEVLMPIAYGRCDAWLYRTYEVKMSDATASQIEALVRVLDHRLLQIDEEGH